jgi:hypothetical protein
MKQLYRVGEGHRVWVDEHQRYFESGEVFELTKVPGTDNMVALGILVEVPMPKPSKVKEKSDGSDN